MSRKWTYALIGSLVTAGVIGGLAAGGNRFGPRFAFAEAPRHHGAGHWHGEKRHFGHFCGEHRDIALDAAISYLKREIDPRETQAEPFARFEESLGAAAGLMAKACDATAPAPGAETAAASLERIETVLSAGLEALRALRPGFDALYATLDDRQREAFDDLLAHERRL